MSLLKERSCATDFGRSCLGMILYLLIYSIAGAILGSAAAESWRPTIAVVAAALAAAGS
jgi:hypothetical protein